MDHPLVGSEYTAYVEGRNSLNGKRYTTKIKGTVRSKNGPGELSLYDALFHVIKAVEVSNREMQLPDALTISLFTPAAYEAIASESSQH